jgi:SAM-dependent methyltransferase
MFFKMSFTVKEISAFYRSHLGKYVKQTIEKELYNLSPLQDIQKTVLGLGYATPYLTEHMKHHFVFSFMPEDLGVELWPDEKLSKVALIHDWLIPLSNQSVDLSILIHSLEFSNHKQAFLQELWRILKKDGSIIVVVPNRLSFWSSFEKTPFGHGSPFTMGQLINLFSQNGFEIVKQKRLLYLPPINSFLIHSLLKPLERLAPYFIKKLSGVNIILAKKKTFILTPIKNEERIRDEEFSLQTV